MDFKVSYRQIFATLIICFIATSVTGLIFTVIETYDKPFDIYVRLTDISWPPSPDLISQKETRVTYGVPMVFEIWNPSKKTYEHTTGNMNLLDPQMKLILEEGYTYVAGYIFWIFITTHEIKPGITVREAYISVQINVYNDTAPPSGNYTVWAGIDGEPEINGDPPFTFKSYKTVIYQEYNSSTIEYAPVPDNWGTIYPSFLPILLWSFSGVELMAIVYLLIRVYKRKSQ
ncbi:MAG: hypothetical protein ACTSQF_06915 [Candidatus Heimdallarchaeaceae archaeon]